jgi:hypothetical protein
VTYRVTVLGGFAVVTLVVGFLGYGQTELYAHRPFGRRAFDQLYTTIQLFSFGAPNPPPNRLLGLARFLVPFTTAWAALATLHAIFADQWLRFRINRLRNHVVVCGLGRTGTRIALGLWEQGYSVLAIDKTLGPSTTELRARGLPVLVGDANNEVLLRHAGMHRATRAVIVCGDDGVNADIALLAAEAGGARSRPLEVVVHVVDAELCQLLHTAVLAGDTPRPIRLEFFNVFDVGPRALLANHGHLHEPDAGLVIVGVGPVGLAVLLEAARRWPHERTGRRRKLPVTVVDVEAGTAVAKHAERYPGITKHCSVRAVDVESLDGLALPVGAATARTVVVCVEPDARAVAVALTLRPQVGQAQVVVCTTERSGFAGLLGGSGTSAWPDLVGFGILDAACRPEVVLGGMTELMARGFHDEYLDMREELAKDLHEQYRQSGGRGQTVTWDDLAEHLRESNRQQADDIHNKLRLVGYRAVPDRDGTAPLAVFGDDEVERMGRAEHDRWWKERAASGWKLGPAKDVERRISPYLVPWEELDEPTRDIDRKFARSLPSVLAKAGFAVVRSGP